MSYRALRRGQTVRRGRPLFSYRSMVALAAVLAATSARLPAGPVVPTDGMNITEDTTFVPGTYNLPNGIRIGASGVTLDMNGAVIVGTNFENYGVRSLQHDDVTIKNGVIRGYYYGIRVENGSNIKILDNDLSLNWVDPDSLGAPAPFLNINVGPVLGDTTNLGGGLFMKTVSAAEVSGNTLRYQENGMDLYFVSESTISDNNASDNTGWGIHMYASWGNVIVGNVADRCIRPGLGDSAGVLVVYGSNGNQFLNNSFQYGGDGFFIGNEHGCPSNDNFLAGNDGSFAGANAFEATFSSGNQFIGNVADGSNYGFWLGYSHSGNVITGNSIRANNVNGIEIEHGQENTIEGNQIIGNGGKGIVLRTDGLVHFPPAQFPCLNLPDQAASSFYTIKDNVVHSNFGLALELINTTASEIVNNIFGGEFGGTATATGAGNVWSVGPTEGENIVGGMTLGGNYWSDYDGEDLDGDGLGDTGVPYTNDGQIAPPADPHPLVGDVDLGGLSNPRTLCDRAWIDLGPNTRTTGQSFETANGTHFATDGSRLYLLEGSNSTRLSFFDPAIDRYQQKAFVPEPVWDGGDLQWGSGLYYATVGVQFTPSTGAGKGAKLYAYNPVANTWSTKHESELGGFKLANEALAYDPVGNRFYATIVDVQTGGSPTLRRRLAIYDPTTDAWISATSAAPENFGAGSEAEYLDGKIYVWGGLLAGGAVNGSNSFLYVFDIAADSWDVTPSLQDFGVIPGFRSGAFDIWGIALTADHANGRLFVIGGETNHQTYVFDSGASTWSVAATAPYDGGWGDSLEYVAASEMLYQIDGRSAVGALQGTATMVLAPLDIDFDGLIGLADYQVFAECMTGPEGSTPEGCHQFDTDCDGDVDLFDGRIMQQLFGN